MLRVKAHAAAELGQRDLQINKLNQELSFRIRKEEANSEAQRLIVSDYQKTLAAAERQMMEERTLPFESLELQGVVGQGAVRALVRS